MVQNTLLAGAHPVMSSIASSTALLACCTNETT
jgi:hypothetical protein